MGRIRDIALCSGDTRDVMGWHSISDSQSVQTVPARAVPPRTVARRSVAALALMLALGGCLVPDDYQAELVPSEDGNLKLVFDGLVTPEEALMSGADPRTIEDPDIVAQTRTYLEGSMFTDIEVEPEAGLLTHVRMTHAGLVSRSPVALFPGIYASHAQFEGRSVWTLRFLGIKARDADQFLRSNYNMSGEVCFVTGGRYKAEDPNGVLRFRSGGVFVNEAWCFDTTVVGPRPVAEVVFRGGSLS